LGWRKEMTSVRDALTDERIDEILGGAYTDLVRQGYNGGMGGLTWDRAAARAIEAALSKQEAATPAIHQSLQELVGVLTKRPPDTVMKAERQLDDVAAALVRAKAALKAAQPVPLNVAAQEQVYSEAPAEGQRAYSPVAVAPDAPSDVVAVHSQHCDEHAECDDLRERMAALLTGVANALRGDPGPLRRWSWHDLPVRAAVMREQRDSAQADFKLLAEAFADAYQPRTALDATPAPQEPAEPVATEQSTVPVYTQARPVRFIRDEQDCKTFMNEQALTLEELADCGLLSELEPPLYTQSVADMQEPAEPVAAKCAECGVTSTPDSMWALYCLPCIESKIAPALKQDMKQVIHSCTNAFSQHPGKCAEWCGDSRTCPPTPKALPESSGVYAAAPQEPAEPVRREI
jgi:hypothetical protein